jgi:twinkle protein
MFHCHYCGWKGCAADTAEDHKLFKWLDAAAEYNNRRKQSYKRPDLRPQGKYSDKILAYFASRGISEATLSSVNVGESEEYIPQVKSKRNCILFNYYLNGELINVKFRDGGKNFKMVSGAELLPYNIDNIKDSEYVIITEGEIDALSFIEAGFSAVVSVPNGANNNLQWLDDYYDDYFADKKRIYLATDTDKKGLDLRAELQRRMGAERCYIIDYGKECKDANELLIKDGKTALVSAVEGAKEVYIDGIFTVNEFVGELDAVWENGWQKGWVVGHDDFDKAVSFEPKRLAVVTGIPGSGKSEFLDEIVYRLNIRYNLRCAYFSPENSPLSYHAAKIAEKLSGKRFSRRSLDYAEYGRVKDHIQDNFFFISPSDNYSIDNILLLARILIRRKGVRIICIDPFNRLDNEQGRESETQYISGVLDKLGNFARLNDVIIFLVAHPTKMPRKKDSPILEMPTMYDINGSANFYNKCDYGIIVHRDREAGDVRVNIAKVKFRHLGEGGTCRFIYNYNNGRYVPVVNGTPLSIEQWDNGSHIGGIATPQITMPEDNVSPDKWIEPAVGDIPF